MCKVLARFLRYAAVDTHSIDDVEPVPSNPALHAFAASLAEEMREMGLEGVRVDEHAYVYGELPANVGGAPSMGLLAHMDTVHVDDGARIRPRVLKGYPGGDIVLESGAVIAEKDTPALQTLVGEDLVVTDGTTVLGADDKAGIAEILTMAETLLAHPEIPHGRVALAFTPDEEVGRGVDFFDLEGFGCDFAYTVDGGALGELEYANFNAASASVVIEGADVHPGSAKGIMKNAARIACEFDALLPEAQRPEYTEGREGFFHLMRLQASVERAELSYLVREHDGEKFEAKKALLRRTADFLNEKYGGCVALTLKDSYYNMENLLKARPELIDRAAEAMRNCGVRPRVVPIRGGTDGVRLTYAGLPCPNLCTGGIHLHSVREFIPVSSLTRMVDVLVELVRMSVEGNT